MFFKITHSKVAHYKSFCTFAENKPESRHKIKKYHHTKYIQCCYTR